MSNFNFQWTKTLYQNNFKLIAFFFTLLITFNNSEEKVLVGAREDKLHKPQFHKMKSYA